MKKRQFEELQFILQNRGSTVEELMFQFKVSRRTVYYDISEINDEIKEYGEIRNVAKKYIYIGDDSIYSQYNINKDFTSDSEARRIHLLDKIFMGSFTTIDEESNALFLSKSTLVSDIKHIRKILGQHGIGLVFDGHYQLIADEDRIRDCYIQNMYLDQDLLGYEDERIVDINKQCKLYLTDYSMALLSKYIQFMDIRLSGNHILSDRELYNDVRDFHYFDRVCAIIGIEFISELKFITALIASMTSLRSNRIEGQIKKFVLDLVSNFEKIAAVDISNKKDFIKEMSRHLQSSFYRLKYRFPIHNGSLYDIKNNYGYLFSLVEESVKSTQYKIFSEMRDSEIAFLAMYFGARMDTFTKSRNRVVIVCPNGKVVSKVLESQLQNYLPTLEIVGVFSIRDLDHLERGYDYIISTTPIEDRDNVVLVNPILTSHNISDLYKKLFNISTVIDENNIEKIVEIVGKNADIKDKNQLKKDLLDYFVGKSRHKITDRNDVKLSDLFTSTRIKKIKSVKDWRRSVEIAAQVLLDEKSINHRYLEDVIKNIETFGSYIVLVDKVAMPHATNRESVNKVDYSILVLEEEVAYFDKMVDVVIFLSTIDNSSHLNMLATLVEIISKPSNIDILRTGDYGQISALFEKYERHELED